MNSKYGYIYKITYTNKNSHLFKHFYYGQHKYHEGESLLDPKGRYYYHGSSIRADREYWPYYSEHKKEIIEWCTSLDELKNKEYLYISENIDDPLCINCTKNTMTNIYERYTPDRCSIQSDGAIKRWRNPDERKKQSDKRKQYFIDHPELREIISSSRLGKNQFKNETPEKRAERIKHISEASKKVWENEEYHKKHTKRLHETVINYYANRTDEQRQAKIDKMLQTFKKNGTSFKGEKNPAYGRKWMHNNIEQAYVKSEEINAYLEKGYVYGKLKTVTDETRKKISDARKRSILNKNITI